MTFTLAVTQAPQSSFFNGGTAADSRQYYARPTQHTPNGPRIAAATAGMTPGEFRSIWLDNADGIFVTINESNGLGYDVLDWLPRAALDQATEQIILGGRRHSYKIYAYSDVTGDWRELPLPAPLNRYDVNTAHYYGVIDEDSSGGVYVGSPIGSMSYRLDPVSESYTQTSAHGLYSGGSGTMQSWDADYNGGTGAMFKYTGSAQAWLRYDPGTDSWTEVATGLGNGMHALTEWLPAAQRFLFVGGTATETRAALVQEDGTVTVVTSAPDDVSMGNDSWIMAHPSGCWLVRTKPTAGAAKLYAAWPNAGTTDVTWQDLGTAPDDGLQYPTAAVDYARGLVYIVAKTGLYAYAFPTVTDPSGTQNLAASGVAVAGGAAALAGDVSLSGVSVAVPGGSAQMSADVSLSAVWLAIAGGSATLDGGAVGDLGAAGGADASGSADLSAVVTIAAAGLAQAAAAAGLSADVLLAAAGAAHATGNAQLAAQLDLLAAAAAQSAGSATLSGGAAGDLSAAGAVVAGGQAVLEITVTLAAAGGGESAGQATIEGGAQGDLAASGAAASAGGATVAAVVSITAAGFVQAMGVGALAVDVPLSAFSAAIASGAATLTAALVLADMPQPAQASRPRVLTIPADSRVWRI